MTVADWRGLTKREPAERRRRGRGRCRSLPRPVHRARRRLAGAAGRRGTLAARDRAAPKEVAITVSWLRGSPVAVAARGNRARRRGRGRRVRRRLPPGRRRRRRANLFMLVARRRAARRRSPHTRRVEWLQTGRLDSIARQFSTRTIVLMAARDPDQHRPRADRRVGAEAAVYLDSIGTILVGVLAGPIAGAATGILSNLAWTFVLAGTPFGSPYAWPFAIVAAEVGLVAGLFGLRGGLPQAPEHADAEAGGGARGGLGHPGCARRGSGSCRSTRTCAGRRPARRRQARAPSLIRPANDATSSSGSSPTASSPSWSRRSWPSSSASCARVTSAWPTSLVAGVACGIISAFIAAPIAALVFGGVTGSGTDLLVALFQAGRRRPPDGGPPAGAHLRLDRQVGDVPASCSRSWAALSRRMAARFPQGERAVGTAAPPGRWRPDQPGRRRPLAGRRGAARPPAARRADRVAPAEPADEGDGRGRRRRSPRRRSGATSAPLLLLAALRRTDGDRRARPRARDSPLPPGEPPDRVVGRARVGRSRDRDDDAVRARAVRATRRGRSTFAARRSTSASS